MDLSHNFICGEGANREHVLINYGKGYFVRDKRFRLNQDGKLYDIPVSSDKKRYSEAVTKDPGYDVPRQRLQALLDDFMLIPTEYEQPGEKSKENKDGKSKPQKEKKKE